MTIPFLTRRELLPAVQSAVCTPSERKGELTQTFVRAPCDMIIAPGMSQHVAVPIEAPLVELHRGMVFRAHCHAMVMPWYVPTEGYLADEGGPLSTFTEPKYHLAVTSVDGEVKFEHTTAMPGMFVSPSWDLDT